MRVAIEPNRDSLIAVRPSDLDLTCAIPAVYSLEVAAMWRWVMFLLCLIAAISGTPLRQAEAASDLARSLEEPVPGDDIEVPDGGVGDDSDATIKAENHDVRGSIALSAPKLPGYSSVFSAATAALLVHRPAPPPPRATSSLAQLLARLQCFLC
jgi:hypothetical protein